MTNMFAGFAEDYVLKLITERYAEIKDLNEFDDSKDALIVDCYKYKLFKDKPSKRFKEDFTSLYFQWIITIS